MKIQVLGYLLIAIFFTTIPVSAQTAKNNDNMDAAYIGTYTKKEDHVDGKAKGVLYLEINRETGAVANLKTVAEVVNPSFVKLSPNGKFLFAVSELGPEDGDTGYIYSFTTEKDGRLQQVSKLATEGLAPAHIEVDRSGKFLFISNYMGGVVMMYRIQENGALEKLQRIDLENPKTSHAHSANISQDNKTLYIADLGNDKIWIYKLDTEKGALVKAEQAIVALEKGAGPRHFSMSKNGKVAYSINELNSSITVLKVLPNGGLEIIQNISSLPKGFSGKNSAADIHIHPSEEYLYVSNRGHNSMGTFKIHEQSGKLKAMNFTSILGETPRGFVLSPDGKFLYVANQDSSSIVVFSIDHAGNLSLISEPEQVPSPVRIELVK